MELISTGFSTQEVFHTRNHLSIEVGPYIIKTATSQAELLESLRLRHLVFYEELIGQSHPTGLDMDRYDAIFDHLIIIDQKKHKVIATYRLYSSDWGDDFYTKSEFDLNNLNKMQGPFLEMGRACVHPDYRRGLVMTLLWRGIAEYFNVSGARVLMGCGSIKTESVEIAALLTCYFKRNSHFATEDYCVPTDDFAMPGYHEALAKISAQEWSNEMQEMAESQIPSLFKSYLKAGAIVAGAPAWDREFKCIDYVILLEKEKMSSTYGKKYGIQQSETACS